MFSIQTFPVRTTIQNVRPFCLLYLRLLETFHIWLYYAILFNKMLKIFNLYLIWIKLYRFMVPDEVIDYIRVEHQLIIESFNRSTYPSSAQVILNNSQLRIYSSFLLLPNFILFCENID